MKCIIRLLVQAKKYYKQLIGAVAGIIAYTAVNLLGPALISQLIDLLTGNFSKANIPQVQKLALLLLGTYIFRAIFRLASDYWAHYAAWNIVAEMRVNLYNHLQNLSLRFYSNKQTGQLMSQVINDTAQFEMLIAHAIPNILSSLFIVTGVAVLLLFLNPWLALLTFVPVPFVLIFSLYYARRIYPAYSIHQARLGDMNAVLQDNLSGLKEIQLFGRQDCASQLFSTQTYQWRDAVMKVVWLGGVYHPAVEGILAMGTVIVVGFGGVMALDGMLSLGDIVRFLLYLSLFYAPLTTLVASVDSLLQAVAGAERVFTLLDAELDIKDKPDAIKLPAAQGSLAFQNVTFYYDKQSPVLEDITFDIPSGSMVAFVGPTGAGKTTMAALLTRFYDPLSGQVLLDGINLRDLSLTSLRNQISVVPQDVFLFNGSIADNIAYGKPAATRDEIIQAAKQAYIHDFIITLPGSYEALVGERGVLLSGGQKQRLAIARALLRDTPILIFDEATASVDMEAETKIQQAIQALAGNRTLIVIAHRLSTVRRADKILVLNNTGIAEQGRHEELLAKGGLYARLCATQIN
ncbi:ATP-binding cassette subfamily B protein/subfamily B ATP-binding cassette protein MsbA [Anaerospora hongkongensis]|uniref:ATP-binding cassette subfamily B protein/subfamily B ATP-binding cassette protein MsbA n=1 Tax=Anaerospora hongkongensis TaxID=244830 RepID=A0A4R1Q2I2_9FIRM|nr:ABC transporter ATP-binding protein [Anaerospora hongkongensis]TCL37858.1 ATP-binding cassette subfamily B protein/subfamily B ATP-binding cassette protein MsbA [Anaerospora hongkongensis]